MGKSVIISGLIVLLAGVSVVLALTFMSMKEFENELDTVKISLKQTESELQLAEINLSETHGMLEDVTAELSNTSVELTTINNRLVSMETQLQSERSKNSQMSSDYTELKQSINSRVTLTAIDMQGFITPDNSVVFDKAFEITGDYTEDTGEYWSDCDRLYKWVVKNIRYSSDSPMPVLPDSLSGELIWRQDYWRKPVETIADKTGDCEDMSLLLTSLLKSYNRSIYDVWCVQLNPDTPGTGGHMAVIFPVANGHIAILDPAGNYYTGNEYGSLSSRIATNAINEWLSYWEKEIPGVKIHSVFSDDFYKGFSSTSEFLEWYANR